jgi:hypothetical protein
MRVKAANAADSLPNVYRQCTATLSANPSAAALMPTLHSLDTAMYRQRQKHMPPLPSIRSDIKIPEIFKQTLAGEDFVIDCTADNDLIIIGSPSNLKHLYQAKIVTMDGTFDGAPKLFTQLFTIHAFYDKKLLPLVFVLMSSKDRASYAKLFEILKSRATSLHTVFKPDIILSDFETGLIAAVRDEFPNANHHGCYFHFTQVRQIIFVTHRAQGQSHLKI